MLGSVFLMKFSKRLVTGLESIKSIKKWYETLKRYFKQLKDYQNN